MINLEHIHSLTDFKRNVKQFLERIKVSKSPLVLTVNGKAEVVVQDAGAFQEMMDRLERAEEELRQMKLEALHRDIAIAAEQLKHGEYTEYDDESLSNLLENIKARGQSKLKRDS
ncbi:type II toxin-antitoxin system Phd/YefM family antitoxin [Fischerella thermalis]|uniref:type II toxin-antitoxin system Phd/YefM family antitoxin n=1 Tax=Fischerella thermalis TaxID=372787 RepID=UPI000C7FF39B|nr:type II toxin-antitoxin system Phd/YefM family antitoxin [Fischerella thermalis]MBF1990107.1 type II toxin-antitoxin system Phd/YefM family antitoxin [Fischerella thermalis M58_A2018_009]MBF2062547.1 type II toxin-antitoxin system Phd/YefM family antitoxin [Fischerella thermalis M66_A2018_004]MBF2068653.1 type II toxin-antitoxin system Phd/YefM family antitoxin [Fischerella thermalis M48_A2018_028]PLZ89059.1 prevent-host-death family protein [Fischerella thermalis CCMEE 5194]